MRRNLPLILFFFLLVIPVWASLAQSRVLKDPEEIRAEANAWLQGLLTEEATVELLGAYTGTRGSMTFDLTLSAEGTAGKKPGYGKGRIQTVFLAETDITDHNFTGKFKDLLKEKVFDWKMQKGTQVKIRFTYEI
ncbi:MAG TPA: hypothetical protein P5550_00210 [Bacteroidales bacterium]|nr:hypothetical protein [Bacteroidales bacterium]